MPDPWDTLKLLSDPTRLRILNLLKREELSVAELQSILDMGQSRISSHLALLRQGGLVEDRKEGKKSFYLIHHGLEDREMTLLEAACIAIRSTQQNHKDLEQLERILDLRRQAQTEYFNSVAGRLTKDYCPGRSWEAIGQFLVRLIPRIDIVDLGAGEGLLSQMLAENAREVVCVDNSPKMVQLGSALAEKNEIPNLRYVLGDIESVPLPDSIFDVAILSQALHHAQKPARAIAEAMRILRPGGHLLVIDLLQHQFEQARELYADTWLGFSINELYHLLRDVGFERVRVDVVAREEEEPRFETVLASGHRPLSTRTRE